MKLTLKERRTMAMIRQLDARQREELLLHMERQLIANRLTARVSGVKRLKIVDNKTIERHYGRPRWCTTSRKPPKAGSAA